MMMKVKVESLVVRELRGEHEADEAGRVCKRGFNAVQVHHLGRMVSFHDEDKACLGHRALASRHKVPPSSCSF